MYLVGAKAAQPEQLAPEPPASEPWASFPYS